VRDTSAATCSCGGQIRYDGRSGDTKSADIFVCTGTCNTVTEKAVR
jgi:hypothetical protein